MFLSLSVLAFYFQSATSHYSFPFSSLLFLGSSATAYYIVEFLGFPSVSNVLCLITVFSLNIVKWHKVENMLHIEHI